MCGIAGSINFSFDYETVNRVMGHRGPDQRNSYQVDNVRFHHLRLSIIDIGGGQQPMHYLDRYTIIYNGEIYNHLDVRQQLGLQCSSGSDTETLLHAWHKEGPAMLQRMDGMFVFAIYDKALQSLFIARDRAGKKPVYYFNNGQQLVFASELNCLKALLPLEPDKENIAAYLRMGSFYQSNTPYKMVKELPNGGWMKVNTQNLAAEKGKWWEIGHYYQQPILKITEADALVEVDGLLRQSVQRRLESSDLEVGSFLSGGIDSGLVTAIASSLHPKLKTFTVSFDGAYNEAPLAKMVADKYQTDHQEIVIHFDHLLDDVENIIAQYGEPFFDSSAIPSWYVSKAAKQHITVVLNGDGADELFGGYRRYVPFAKYNFFRQSPVVKMMASSAANLFPPGNERKSNYNYLYRLMSLASKKGVSTYFASWTDIFEGFEQYIWQGSPGYLNEEEGFYKLVTDQSISGLRQLMWLDFEINLFDDLLVKMDIATMAQSLEGRSPFLCKEFLEWVPTLPDNLKVQGATTKYLLRKLAVKYLPSELIDQPKRGFEIPLKQWVNGELKDLIASYLLNKDCFYPAIIQQQFVTNLLENKVKVSSEKRAKMIWTIFCLEVWYHKCLKQQL